MRAVAGNTWGANKKVLLTIYRSLIRSVLDYGAIAYVRACDKALRIACGAFCSTPVSALEVETCMAPTGKTVRNSTKCGQTTKDNCS